MKGQYIRGSLLLVGTVFLAGCASLPKVAYSGPVVPHAALSTKTVQLHTEISGAQFDDHTCLMQISRSCRDLTLPEKATVSDYNTLLGQGLVRSGAKVVDASSPDLVITTDIVPETGHRYLFLLDYNVAKTVAIGLIPFAGAFMPDYYRTVSHMEDRVTVREDGKVIFHHQYTIQAVHHITDANELEFKAGETGSKAVRIYISEQSAVISRLLPALDSVLIDQGAPGAAAPQ